VKWVQADPYPILLSYSVIDFSRGHTAPRIPRFPLRPSFEQGRTSKATPTSDGDAFVRSNGRRGGLFGSELGDLGDSPVCSKLGTIKLGMAK